MSASISKLIKYKKIKQTKIAKCNDGMVELSGRCHSIGEHVTSPYSNKKCIYFELNIYRWESDSEDLLDNWSRIYSVKKRKNFKLKDSSGEIEIDIQNAEYELNDKQVKEFSDPSTIKQLAEKIFENDKVKKERIAEESIIKIEERCLDLGKKIYVIGHKQGTIVSRTNHELIISENTKKARVHNLRKDMLIYTATYFFISIVVRL